MYQHPIPILYHYTKAFGNNTTTMQCHIIFRLILPSTSDQISTMSICHGINNSNKDNIIYINHTCIIGTMSAP